MLVWLTEVVVGDQREEQDNGRRPNGRPKPAATRGPAREWMLVWVGHSAWDLASHWGDR